MQHQKCIRMALLAMAAVSVQGFVQAGVSVLPPPGPARVAKADVVVVGEVVGIEPMDAKVGIAMYRIAVVKVADPIKGAKGQKTVRVGFTPLPKPDPTIFVSGPRPIQLESGQGGLFLLKKHATGDFYMIGGNLGYLVRSEKNKNFGREVAAAKAAALLATDPKAGLRSKNADERLLAAAIVLDDYRTFRGPKSTEAPIDADESKLLMSILADADWKGGNEFLSLRPGPQELFQHLGVGAKDGFTIPKGTDYLSAAQAWVRMNSQTYRIKRFVAAGAK